MIVFDLACECGLIFEGWFGDRADCARQEGEGLLICPACGGGEIRKILSPVHVRLARVQGEVAIPVVKPDSPESAARDVLRTLQDLVRQNFEDVGPRLAEESLRVRYGLAAERNLRGVATPAEEEMLAREGIKLLKIPFPAKPTGDA